ncbi:uncharacterized protein [Spinacia oleracea]|uniref:Retrotransposon Copia-like N-terminal domain-containing protein n=1 Tax=Spinacia oleracea TaxID=3562 RepID=A0A9R0HZA7_SPIOL|nr:uncharacterized protein LOC110781811 [Spinacia oleracea]
MAKDDETPKSSPVFHPALGVTNITNLVKLTLDVNQVQYTPWVTLFRNTAKAYHVFDHIDPTVPRPMDIDDSLWERLDAIALQWIYGTITTDLLFKVLDDNATAMVVWDRLRKLFQNNKGTRVVHLENQFGNTRLQDFSTLDEYCQALRTISVQLASLGHPVSEERLVLQLVARLTDEYKTIATIIQQSVPLPSFEEACDSLDLDRRSRD